MSLEARKDTTDSSLAIRLSGTLGSADVARMKAAIDQGLSEHVARIQFDCSDLDALSSDALRVLVGAIRRAGETRLAVRNAHGMVREALEMTGIARWIELDQPPV